MLKMYSPQNGMRNLSNSKTTVSSLPIFKSKAINQFLSKDGFQGLRCGRILFQSLQQEFLHMNSGEQERSQCRGGTLRFFCLYQKKKFKRNAKANWKPSQTIWRRKKGAGTQRMKVIRLKETKLLQNFLLERKISEGLHITRPDLRLHLRKNRPKIKNGERMLGWTKAQHVNQTSNTIINHIPAT